MVIPRQTDSADIFDEKINKQKEIRKSSQTDAAVIDDGHVFKSISLRINSCEYELALQLEAITTR